MANEAEGPSKAVAITKFTVRNDTDAFEQAFKTHADFVRAQKGFRQFQAVRSVITPNVYVNIGWWDDTDTYLQVLQSPEFQEDIRKMADLVTVDPHLCTKVSNGLRIAPEGGNGNVEAYSEERIVVTTIYSAKDNPEAFEKEFADHAMLRREQEGFIFHEALRSVNQPGSFINVEWWLSQDAYQAALQSDRLKSAIARIMTLADIQAEQAQNFANGEPIETKE